MFESWALDLKYALRRLRHRPTYTLLTVLTLALGVAGTAAVFGTARRLLLDPLPIRAEEEVAVFWFGGGWNESEFALLRPEMNDFEAVAATRPADATLDVRGEPTRLVSGLSVTAELFTVLGVSPALGPGFRPGDDAVGAAPAAVLSHRLWRELGSSPSIVGERIELAGRPHTVVGVMPAGFWFSDPSIEIWLAEELDPNDQVGSYTLIGRLRPGLEIAAMGPQLERITRLLDQVYGAFPEQWDPTRDPHLIPVREHLVGSVRPALLALLGAMALLLVIACVNVAALMLGQVDTRGTELAVRSALGAGRRRLLQQLVAESAVLGALAGLGGAALAAAGFPVLVRALPLGALADTALLDWSVFWVAMATATIAATAAALLPGLSVARSDLRSRLVTTRTGGIGGRGGRLESGLVVAQVALVLLLAAGAALLVRSVANLRSIDPGVEVDAVAALNVSMPAAVEQSQRPQVVDQLVRAVGALPGVESAAATQRLPLRGSGNNWGILVEGRPDLEATTTAFRIVSPGYLETMGIRLRSGRGLLETDRDAGASEGVVVINQAAADRYFPGVDPLGRRVAFKRSRWDRVVGVVENVAEATLTAEPVPTRYMVYEQVGEFLDTQTIVVRTAPGHDPSAILDSARRTVQAMAPGVAVHQMTTMRSIFERAIGPALQVMSLLTLLGGLAMALGVIGVYGVVSHFVNRRQREWGIHLALGMAPPAVAGRIVARGGAMLAIGIAIGLAAFLALARLLGSFLYGVSATDLGAIASATAILVAAGLLATLIPARRASRIDPAVVLREQ